MTALFNHTIIMPINRYANESVNNNKIAELIRTQPFILAQFGKIFFN
jgi:hypothetical protein